MISTFRVGLLCLEAWTVEIVTAVHEIKLPNVPYSKYYKPMGNLPYISSEQGVGIVSLLREYTI